VHGILTPEPASFWNVRTCKNQVHLEALHKIYHTAPLRMRLPDTGVTIHFPRVATLRIPHRDNFRLTACRSGSDSHCAEISTSSASASFTSSFMQLQARRCRGQTCCLSSIMVYTVAHRFVQISGHGRHPCSESPNEHQHPPRRPPAPAVQARAPPGFTVKFQVLSTEHWHVRVTVTIARAAAALSLRVRPPRLRL
jgi:hypothetical protein